MQLAIASVHSLLLYSASFVTRGRQQVNLQLKPARNALFIIADSAPPDLAFSTSKEGDGWLTTPAVFSIHVLVDRVEEEDVELHYPADRWADPDQSLHQGISG